MKKSILRWTGLLVILAVVVGGLLAYRLYNKPHRSATDGPAMEVSAAALAAAYNSNEANANKQYLGQLLEIRGVVDGQLENQQHGKTIMLLGDALSGVQCAMVDSNTAVSRGDTITVRGFCNGFLADVVMDRCILIIRDNSHN